MLRTIHFVSSTIINYIDSRDIESQKASSNSLSSFSKTTSFSSSSTASSTFFSNSNSTYESQLPYRRKLSLRRPTTITSTKTVPFDQIKRNHIHPEITVEPQTSETRHEPALDDLPDSNRFSVASLPNLPVAFPSNDFATSIRRKLTLASLWSPSPLTLSSSSETIYHPGSNITSSLQPIYSEPWLDENVPDPESSSEQPIEKERDVQHSRRSIFSDGQGSTLEVDDMDGKTLRGNSMDNYNLNRTDSQVKSQSNPVHIKRSQSSVKLMSSDELTTNNNNNNNDNDNDDCIIIDENDGVIPHNPLFVTPAFRSVPSWLPVRGWMLAIILAVVTTILSISNIIMTIIMS